MGHYGLNETYIPWSVREKTTYRDAEVEELDPTAGPFLKPEVIECMLKKLPSGTIHQPGEVHDLFLFPSDDAVGVIFPPEEDIPEEYRRDDVTAEDLLVEDEYTEHELPYNAVYGENDTYVDMVFQALMKCRPEKISQSAIQKAVATREGKKAYRSMLGWKGPEGKQLPTEVARNIAKFTASKTAGKRKQTHKKRKGRKQTKRRRN